MRTALTVAAFCASMVISNAHAAESTQQKLARLESEIQELKAQINATADQVEENQVTLTVSQTHINGYGELHYRNLERDGSGKQKDEIDVHRFVLEFGHDFNSNTRFTSNIELEHAVAGEGKNGVVELEQAYIEHDFNDNFQGRAGVMLIPVGILNQAHEPPAFYGVERNPVEQNIIPASWWAGGIGISGSTKHGIRYDLMLHEGLKVKNDFNIRSGRQKTAEATATDLATTARIKYTGTLGVEWAATFQHQPDFTQGETHGGSANLIETHIAYNHGSFSLKALYAKWDLDSDDAKAAGKDKQDGYYIEAAYKVRPKLGVFGRYNKWDNGGAGNTATKQIDLGVNYYLHDSVVFKADIQLQTHRDSSQASDGFNLGVGYQF